MDCSHEKTELRYMVFANGTKHVCEQCLLCGQRMTQFISQDGVELDKIKPFDDNLRDNYSANMQKKRKEIVEKRIQDRKDAYGFFLRTPEWQFIRHKVMSRDQGLCQCCREESATQVHHEQYWPNIADTPLWYLHAICDKCHKMLHDKDVDYDGARE